MSRIRQIVEAIFQLSSAAGLVSCPVCGGSGREAGLPSLPLSCHRCEGTGATTCLA